MMTTVGWLTYGPEDADLAEAATSQYAGGHPVRSLHWNRHCVNCIGTLSFPTTTTMTTTELTYGPEDADLAEAATSQYADGLGALGRRAVDAMDGGRGRRRRRAAAVLRVRRRRLLRRRATRTGAAKQRRPLGHLLSENPVHRRR